MTERWTICGKEVTCMFTESKGEGSTLDKKKQTVGAYNAYTAKADNGL